MTKPASTKVPIPPMRKLFAERYLVSLNATTAALEAGYSKKTARRIGSELLHDPRVKEVIHKGAKERSERNKVDADWVLNEQVKVYKRCMTVDPILDKEGNQTGEFKFDASGANKALENVGKHVNVNAFKGVDDTGTPIDQNWKVTIVDGRKKPVDP